LSKIPLKTTADSVQVVQHFTCKQKVVAGSNPAADSYVFFLEIIPFGHAFLLSTFETAVTWHPNHLWRWDLSEIKHPSSVNLKIDIRVSNPK